MGLDGFRWNGVGFSEIMVVLSFDFQGRLEPVRSFDDVRADRGELVGARVGSRTYKMCVMLFRHNFSWFCILVIDILHKHICVQNLIVVNSTYDICIKFIFFI